MSWTKSLRFKLTIIYSIIIFFFAGVLVLILNLFLQSFLRIDPEQFPPLPVQGQTQQTQTVIFFQDLSMDEKEHIRETRIADLQRFEEVSIISLAPLAIISFMIGYFVSGRFLAPLKLLKKEIDEANSESLGKQIPVTSQDEIGELVKSYNEMSLRLQKSFEAQTQFVQDASHELRTPLTIMKTNMGVTLDDDLSTKEELKSAINKSLEAVDNLTKLTENLLTLTTPVSTITDKIKINEMVSEQVNSLAKYSELNHVSLKLKLNPKEKTIKGNKIRLSRAIFNIIENALKYSMETTNPIVKVATAEDKGRPVISITDNGKGIPENEQQKIFERFYRIEKSRNKKTGGFGLGLAISKKIIEEMKGKIQLTSKPGETVFIIHL